MREVARGLQVVPPSTTCDDPKCPYHGKVTVRGKTLDGVVLKDKVPSKVVVRIEYLHYDPKYKRYQRRRGTIPAHRPKCVQVKAGDRVTIGETRPLTKTVHFVVLGKVS
jgi:small subunit ribosomal protein S17